MPKVVFAIYKPFENKEEALLKIIKTHTPVLRSEGLINNEKVIVLKAKNGEIIEIFQWKDQQAIDDAHSNKNVIKHWEAFSKVCSYKSLNSLTEAKNIFPDFELVNL